MKLSPTVPVGLKDSKLITLLTTLVNVLKYHPDHQCYTVTAVWRVPFILTIPPAGNPQPRNIRPATVRLASAVLTEAPETTLEWGATTWYWRGNSIVRILNQAGLVEDVRYTLTFEVVG